MRSRWARSLGGTAILLALLLVAAACGGDDGGGAGGEEERTVIRFAFAPDPVWDYMNDNGMIVEWEEEFNTRIVATSTWDEFTFFAGGHGDIVSIGTYELPVLEKETDIDTVTFGVYNNLHVPFFTRADEPYETLADVPKGSKICVSSAVSNTIFWSVVASELHGLDYRVGGGDFELVINDHYLNGDLLVRGECEAAAVIPEAMIPLIRNEEVKFMYDGQMPFTLWQDVADTDHVGPSSNLFTATAEWYEGHEEEAAAFLELWQRGVDAWSENQEEIIKTYPQHFTVEEEEDVAWLIDYMSNPENDWFVDQVYFDQNYVDQETEFYDYMRENGWAEEVGDSEPRFEIVEPPSAN
ncbi:MAG TPA: ABC transporter substrate-binding protein [Actinomycetota bacterium]|nr:ABC transporter substrate-binding protein [Actinomycetota bacterium]